MKHSTLVDESCGGISARNWTIRRDWPLRNQTREWREAFAYRSSQATYLFSNWSCHYGSIWLDSCVWTLQITRYYVLSRTKVAKNSQINVFFSMCDTCHPCECPTLYLSLPRLELLEKRTRLCVKWNLFLKIWRYRAKSRFFVTLHRLIGSENENVLLCLICAYVELANTEVVLLNERIARGKCICVFSYHVLHTLIRY